MMSLSSKQNLPKKFYGRSAFRTLFALGIIWFGILSLFFVCGKFQNILVWVGCGILIGVLQYHLNIIGHDGLHYSLMKSKRWNDFVCRWFLHGPQGAVLSAMRTNHIHHHLNLGSLSDHDRQYYDIRRFKTSRQLTSWLVFSCFGGMTYPIIKKLVITLMFSKKRGSAPVKSHSPKDRGIVVLVDILAVLGTQLGLVVITALLSGKWWAYLPLWMIPLFTVMMGLNTIRSCLEHADVLSKKPIDHEYTFKSNWIERFFLSPYAMNFHIEHHAYMGVAYYHLPKVRAWMVQNQLLKPEKIWPTYWSKFQDLCDRLS